MKTIEIAAVSAAVLLAAGHARAHVPTVLPHDTSVDHLVRLPEPIEKSVAFYASFERAGDVDAYGFTLGSDAFDASRTLTDVSGLVRELVVTAPDGQPGRLLHVGTLVPACPAYAAILPTVAIVGPTQDGLPAQDGTLSLPAGVEVSPDEGVLLLQNPTQGAAWYERFTYKSYFDQEDADVVVTQEGDYRIYVWDANDGVGDYVLETGPIEVFGPREIQQTLLWVTHVIYDGEIGSAACKAQLQALDGRNPGLLKVLEDYGKMFAQ